LKILVLGGTVFLGRHFVEAALAAGHELTLFHRGLHGRDLFPQVSHVFGDRDGGLGALPDDRWDAVVDCCGYVPRIVGQSGEALSARAGRYLFVSTISVYADQSRAHLDESAAVGKLADPSSEEITGEAYGPLKALCEQEVLKTFGPRALVIRPGLIAGPHDPTNRFTYWADRYARGGDLIVPARLDQPFQLIDVRDLAAFMLRCLEQEESGTFNATGPDERHTFGDMLQTLAAVWPQARPVPLTESQLLEHDIALWQEMPLAVGEDGESDGMMRVSIQRALDAGLTFRPLAETARDTHEWSRTADMPSPPRHGLAPEKEERVLAQISGREAS
jgi:2'-hydroxyisoflavone reductase